MFITPAYAQGTGGGGGDMLLQLLPFILIFVVMYFLILRPQQRRVKQHREMVNAVRRGDTIVTTGGIIGKVSKVTEGSDEIQVEVAEGVRVQVVRQMIAEVRAKGQPAKSQPAKEAAKS